MDERALLEGLARLEGKIDTVQAALNGGLQVNAQRTADLERRMDRAEEAHLQLSTQWTADRLRLYVLCAVLGASSGLGASALL